MGLSQREGHMRRLVDSSGIKFLDESGRQHRPKYRRQWRKLRQGVDAHTLEIRAIEVTGSTSVCDQRRSTQLTQQFAHTVLHRIAVQRIFGLLDVPLQIVDR